MSVLTNSVRASLLYLRGLAFTYQDAVEREVERCVDHLLGGRPHLQLDLRLGRDEAGVVLHVDGPASQHLPASLLVHLVEKERSSMALRNQVLYRQWIGL